MTSQQSTAPVPADPAAGDPREPTADASGPRSQRRQVEVLRRRVVALLAWVPSVVLTLIAFYPTRRAPLQGDDFWLVLEIHGDPDVDVTAASFEYMTGWMAGGTHFNPVAHFFDAFLKGEMLASRSTVMNALAIHHGAIIALGVATMVMVALLLRRLLAVVADVRMRAATVAVPVSLGLLCAIQVTGTLSLFDPLLAHPAYAALPTFFGFAYLAAGVAALAGPRSVVRTVLGAALGVLGFLTYDGFIVFVAGLAFIAWHYRGRLSGARDRRLLAWLLVPAMVTLVVGRLVVATHDVEYDGTSVALGRSLPVAWVSSLLSSVPGSQWSTTSSDVDLALVGRFALMAGLLAALVSAAWFLLVRRPAEAGPAAPGTGSGTGSPVLRVITPFVVLALLAPLPYVVTAQWSAYLLSPGRTYMHSLALTWAWAAALAVVAVRLLSLRRKAIVVPVVAVGLLVWVTLQTTVNSQIVAALVREPWYGVDIARVLSSGGTGSEPERCASLDEVTSIGGVADVWVPILNRVHEARFGEPYCADAGRTD